MTPSLVEVVVLSPARATLSALQQGFRLKTCSIASRGTVSGVAAKRRDASRVPQMCPECVRVFLVQTTLKCQFAGTLGKPSDGLEPSTPSLPWRIRSGAVGYWNGASD